MCVCDNFFPKWIHLLVVFRILYRYERHLRTVKISGIRKGAITGVFMGFMSFIVYSAYALVCIPSPLSVCLRHDQIY